MTTTLRDRARAQVAGWAADPLYAPLMRDRAKAVELQLAYLRERADAAHRERVAMVAVYAPLAAAMVALLAAWVCVLALGGR